MKITFLKRGFFHRLFGIPATRRPSDPQAWRFAEGRIAIDLARAPELKSPGGALRLEGGRLPWRVLVVHGDDGAFHAFQNRCSHIGHRRLDPVPGTKTIQCCSVGRSTYTYDGEKIFGPSTGPIRTLAVVREGDRLIVSLS
ncbi:MAG: Rieske 2Fe-2S domain-containing protein [Desulfobacterales bacterium]